MGNQVLNRPQRVNFQSQQEINEKRDKKREQWLKQYHQKMNQLINESNNHKEAKQKATK